MIATSIASLALIGGLLFPSRGSDDIVRISVLSLLKPAAVEVRCSGDWRLLADGSDGKSRALVSGAVARLRAEGGRIAVDTAAEGEGSSGTIMTDEINLRRAAQGAVLTVDVVAPSAFSRRFGADLVVRCSGGELMLVAEVPLEQAVAEVVAAEMGDGGRDEALAALAVAVRSYIVALRGRHAEQGFDLCDTTHCLLYRGLDGAFGAAGKASLERGRSAAAQTAGLVLTYRGKVVPGYFNACCGGATASPEMIWVGAAHAEGIEPVRCGLCEGSPNYAWTGRVDPELLLRALGLVGGNRGLSFETKCFPGTGFVSSVRVKVEGVDREFGGEEFRMLVGRALGWDTIRSNAFALALEGDSVALSGRGFGHGVGLCQEGAAEAARRGLPWRTILRHYFPRCDVRKWK